MRICAVCPYCGAALEPLSAAASVPLLVACWRCLRPIVTIQAAREPSVVELEGIDADALNTMRKAALAYRESIRE